MNFSSSGALDQLLLLLLLLGAPLMMIELILHDFVVRSKV